MIRVALIVAAAYVMIKLLRTGFSRLEIKRSHFAGGDLTPPLLKYRKGDARPLWKLHLIVPASRGGVNIEYTIGREYRRRLKKAFDAEGIEMPLPARNATARIVPATPST